MAKYTETLQEYLEDNDLPTKFEEIDGFSELFIGRYCDSEIGFETEELFTVKLQHYADLYIDVYKERIQDVASALTKIKAPVKTVYTQADFGGRKNKRTDLPVDSTDVTPTSIDESERATDNTNVQESGHNAQDSITLFKTLNEQVKIIVDELLKQFNKCFMGIY